MKAISTLLPILAIALVSATSSFAAETCEKEILPQGSLPDLMNDGYGLGDYLNLTQEIDLGSKNLDLEPVVNLNADWGRRVINLSSDDARSSPRKLQLRNYSRGFQVLDVNKLEIGLGVGGSLQNSTGVDAKVWPVVGLMPTRGKAIASSRYVSNKDDAYDLPKIQLPITTNTLNKLNQGDSISYLTSGGIVFWAGIGVSEFEFAFSAVARGDFQVYIQKTQDGQALVSVKDQALRSYGFQKGALFISAGVNEFSRDAKSLTFLVNYDSAEGKAALYNIIRGNIAVAQMMAKKTNPDVVKVVSDEQTKALGNSSYVDITIPFLINFSWSEGGFTELSRKHKYGCGQNLESRYSVYMNQNAQSIYEIMDENESNVFYGVAHRTLNRSGQRISSGLFGEMVLSSENEYSSQEEIRLAMANMSAKTGLHSILMLEAPEVDEEDYTALKLRMRLSPSNTRNLVLRAQGAKERIRSMGRVLVRKYLAAGDKDKLCSAVPQQVAQTAAMASEACYNYLNEQTQDGADGIWMAAASMKKALENRSEKQATKAYAQLGAAMLKNQFAFKIGVMLAGKGVKLDYVLEGTEISRHALTFTSINDSAEFGQDNRALLNKND